MARSMIDVRIVHVDGSFDFEVWADGIVALKLAIPSEEIDLMLYSHEQRKAMILSDCIGRWRLNANDGPVARRGR